MIKRNLGIQTKKVGSDLSHQMDTNFIGVKKINKNSPRRCKSRAKSNKLKKITYATIRTFTLLTHPRRK